MNEREKQEYLRKYQQAKEKGVPFFPDILFKDAVVSLIIFIVLASLAYFVGAPLEDRANPADTSYNPRPEWYFIFLFQLLKYFPGNLEVIGVVVIPTLGILLLFLLPLLDRSPRRHYLKRPVITAGTALVALGVFGLTIQAKLEAPPPAEVTKGDQTAALYAKNCAGCHGPSIEVPTGTNLHKIISQGKHEGMPAWSADLTTDQIDALAGFILSPMGSKLFTQNCGNCHQAPDLVARDPIELKKSLEQGKEYPAHSDLEIPSRDTTLSQEERTALLNFLVAPDGQRLFALNCSPCHGRSVAFPGNEEELRSLISRGGLHLEMPPWREKLSSTELETLAHYVADPSNVPQGEALFDQYCTSCHGERIPVAKDIDQARQTIATGGAHETMPIWGDVLTEEQMDALMSYILQASEGTPPSVGQQLFSQNCSPCHGDFGEGGPNPSRPDDIIAPISSEEYLKTRDDLTLRSIISQGQPNFGMSPFGSAFGGPLDDEQIDAIVAHIRSWEENPPVELPPEVTIKPISLRVADIYADVCAQCHGPQGEGLIGPSLQDPQFQAQNSDQELFETISQGHEASSMIAWGEVLTSDQIQQLVEYIRTLKQTEAEETSRIPTFIQDIQPIFEANCVLCHGSLGGWDATSYNEVMTSGDHAPVVIPGC
jgi:mono/diheme cytochrome c family protein